MVRFGAKKVETSPPFLFYPRPIVLLKEPPTKGLFIDNEAFHPLLKGISLKYYSSSTYCPTFEGP